MKVEAIKNFSTGKNYNFGAREKSHEGVRAEGRADSSMLTKVPVIVMLAMNPVTLNSAIPTMPETDNPNRIVMTSPEQRKLSKSDCDLIPMLFEVEQSDGDFILPLESQKALNVQNVRFGINNYKFVYATNGYKQDAISYIYAYKNGGKTNPGNVIKLIYHEPEDGKNFLGAVIRTNIYKDYQHIGYIESEISLPDDVANFINNVLNNKSVYKNNLHNVKVYSTTNKNFMPPNVVKFD
ncbi:hypothetical protein J6I39_03790 [bacterium]|nr:hypothetical protein [bacterium]